MNFGFGQAKVLYRVVFKRAEFFFYGVYRRLDIKALAVHHTEQNALESGGEGCDVKPKSLYKKVFALKFLRDAIVVYYRLFVNAQNAGNEHCYHARSVFATAAMPQQTTVVLYENLKK